jgi:serine O-acetyltransferase
MNFTDIASEFYDAVTDDYLTQDLERWTTRLKLTDLSNRQNFIKCFSQRQEFRSVIRYRVKCFSDKSITKKFQNLINEKDAFVPSFYLSCKDIGPGFYIEHGFSSIVFASKIGDNFHLNQSVTIGAARGGIPLIGNNVSVHCHSVVLGNITLGDWVKVAAGAVVVDNVPERCIVASPKAIIIKRNVGG